MMVPGLSTSDEPTTNPVLRREIRRAQRIIEGENLDMSSRWQGRVWQPCVMAAWDRPFRTAEETKDQLSVSWAHDGHRPRSGMLGAGEAQTLKIRAGAQVWDHRCGYFDADAGSAFPTLWGTSWDTVSRNPGKRMYIQSFIAEVMLTGVTLRHWVDRSLLLRTLRS